METAAEVAPVATVVAAATGNAERERDAAAVAAEMEEREEARVGEAPAAEVEETELLRGCEHAMMRICPPCPFGTGKTRVLS